MEPTTKMNGGPKSRGWEASTSSAPAAIATIDSYLSGTLRIDITDWSSRHLYHQHIKYFFISPFFLSKD